MGAAAVVIVLAKQREVVEVYQGAGATSPATARDPNELGIDQSMIFAGLVRRAILRDAGNGRYYIDNLSWDAMNASRRRRSIVIMAVFAIATLGVVLVGLTRLFPRG